uniref:aldo/keto reductase n=1 Tax=Aeromicrobium sp. TaxID=1871063 RepID=UPI002FC7AEAF
MDRVQLGTSDLEVSSIILGCMSYGDPDRGTHPWTLPEEQSRPFIQQALDAGITTFDTANMY